MGVIDREEINGFTKEQVEEAIEQLQTATGEARDAILAKLSSGGSSVIKSIQRGAISLGSSASENSAEINPVNEGKAFVSFGGSSGSGSNASLYVAGVKLVSPTKVTAYRGSTGGSAKVYFEVIEFN